MMMLRLQTQAPTDDNDDEGQWIYDETLTILSILHRGFHCLHVIMSTWLFLTSVASFFIFIKDHKVKHQNLNVEEKIFSFLVLKLRALSLKLNNTNFSSTLNFISQFKRYFRIVFFFVVAPFLYVGKQLRSSMMYTSLGLSRKHSNEFEVPLFHYFHHDEQLIYNLKEIFYNELLVKPEYIFQ